MSRQGITIGFLGFGKMGSAIASRLVREAGISITAYDPALQDSALPEGVGRVSTAAELSGADLVILAVKPGELETAVEPLRGAAAKLKFVSICAGVSVQQIGRYLGLDQSAQIARVMPNISAIVAHSVSGVYCSDPELRDLVLDLFGRVGAALALDREDLMHAVTGLSGSGPAFVFAFVQALAEGGVREGLSYADSLRLAIETTTGACRVLTELGGHPAEWRNKVTSPGGTTIAGLTQLEQGSFHGLVVEAVSAAAARSRELGAAE